MPNLQHRKLSTIFMPSILAFALLGCGPLAEFTITDPINAPRYQANAQVFIDRLPPAPYHSVGILVVKAASDWPLSHVMEVLKKEGSRYGCEVVVAREIHRVSFAIPGSGPYLAMLEPNLRHPSRGRLAYGYAPAYSTMPQSYVAPATPIYVAPSPPAPDREFICGLYDRIPR